MKGDLKNSVIVIGPTISQSIPAFDRAESFLLKNGGKDLGRDLYDEKMSEKLLGMEMGSQLIKYPYKGVTYIVGFYNPRGGARDMSIIKGGTSKSRKEFRNYLRKELGMRKRED